MRTQITTRIDDSDRRLAPHSSALELSGGRAGRAGGPGTCRRVSIRVCSSFDLCVCVCVCVCVCKSVSLGARERARASTRAHVRPHVCLCLVVCVCARKGGGGVAPAGWEGLRAEGAPNQRP